MIAAPMATRTGGTDEHASTSGGRAAAATVPPDPGRIMQLGLGFWGSKTLLSAIELGVFTELADGARDGEALAAALGLHPRGASDFLDALVALGMLAREDGLYANTAETDTFLDRRKPTYVGGMLEMAGVRLYPFWGSLTDALRTGRPQNEMRAGGDFFAAIYADPDRLAHFLHAMTALSTGAAIAIAQKFPFGQRRSVLDLGCAEGGVLAQILGAHDHLTGIGFDLPACREHFDRHLRGRGLDERVTFHAGDFFTDPLPAADVVVLGHILHDWDLGQKRALLGRVHDALPTGGALIVLDAIIDDERRENTFGLLMSLNMLIESPGGFDYTGADCQAWMRDSGFSDTYVEHLAGPDSMVVGIK
jgi:SAM-dependent methyltransferase